MEMIGQGWPLYAAAVGEGKVYAIVGWYVREQGHPVPYGVEITQGSTSAPYAVELTTHAEVVVGPDVRTMQHMAGPKREADGLMLTPWVVETSKGRMRGWVDERNQEHWMPEAMWMAGMRPLYVGPVRDGE